MRRKDREVTNREDILRIVNDAKYLHLALFDGEYPYIVSMHYGFVDSDPIVFYMHSAKEGHKIDLIKSNCNAAITLECNVILQESSNACSYTSTFSSIFAKGKVFLVEDNEEKKKALELIMKNQSGKHFDIKDNMASSVAIIKFVATELSAKEKK